MDRVFEPFNEDFFHKPEHKHVSIAAPSVAFPFVDYDNGGFGRIVVDLQQGTSETITIPYSNGQIITVHRKHPIAETCVAVIVRSVKD